ncbi:MAG: 16S rRNA (guanine(966)-N(2))-methyltransferase RsmD [Candidatus Acidiferrum sp.]
MRIIGGTYRSRILKSLKDLDLRPTSDYLRETLFNVLGASVSGARFIDVFAGTGAVGLEAVSRDALEVVFIEKQASAATLIRKNMELLGVNSGATVLAMDAVRGLEKVAARQKADDAGFDYVFLDPPYAAAAEYSRVLDFLGSSALLSPEGVVIAEHGRKFDLPKQFGTLQRVRVIRHGDAALSFFRRA